jgi:hypothetical protein
MMLVLVPFLLFFDFLGADASWFEFEMTEATSAAAGV